MTDDEKWHWASDAVLEDGDEPLAEWEKDLLFGKNILDVRQQDYGDAVVNHTRIARLWSAYLGHNITPGQVALCMLLVKVSRLANTPGHPDSIVDAHGYLDIYQQCTQHATKEKP